MSAVVTVKNALGTGLREVEVPKANRYEIKSDGLHLLTEAWGQQIAHFKSWEYVVIAPDRGPNGRFVKKG